MKFRTDLKTLGAILATLPGFVIVLDRDGVIHYINRLEPGFDADVLGRNAETIVAPGSHEVFQKALGLVFATGEKQQFEAGVALPDGSAAWYRSEMCPFRENGEVIAVILTATNINQLMESRETVAHFRKLLPICSWCDRLRTEQGSWETIESFLKREVDTDVSHALCADCYRRETAGLDLAEGKSATTTDYSGEPNTGWRHALLSGRP